MVNVNGQQSQAVVIGVDTDADGMIGMLFIDLKAPLSEIEQWPTDRPIHVKVQWKPKFYFLPIHPSLTQTLGSSSAQGFFVAHTRIIGDCLYVLLQSSGQLTPLAAN